MAQRIITALILLPLALAVILLPPTWLFALIVAVVFLGAQWEWTRLCGLHAAAGRWAVLVATAIVGVALWCGRQYPGLWLGVLLAGLLWWLASMLWLRGYTYAASPTFGNRMLKLAAGWLIFMPAWVALTALHATTWRDRWWVLLAIAIVWAADIGAYFCGRAFGRRKLAPRISPGKTRAGAWGAAVAGIIIALIGGWLLDIRGWELVALGVLGGITVAASILGDLVESLMKRHASVKDSGQLIPGHGGLLDRLDSVFAALPIFVLGKLVLGL